MLGGSASRSALRPVIVLNYTKVAAFSHFRSVFLVYCNAGGQQFKEKNVNVLCYFLVLAGPASRSALRPVIGR